MGTLGHSPSSPFPTAITAKLLSSDHPLPAAVCTVAFASGLPLRWLGSRFLIQLNQAAVWDHGIHLPILQNPLDGSLRFVQLALTKAARESTVQPWRLASARNWLKVIHGAWSTRSINATSRL